MFKMHPGARAEPVLAAWGITTSGAPVFVALAAGGSESTDAWGDFLDELKTRGLRPPLLVTDGAAGLINAAESSLPRSLRQHCLIHYADLRIMSTLMLDPLQRRGFVLARSA